MKKTNLILIVLGVVLIGGGLLGIIYSQLNQRDVQKTTSFNNIRGFMGVNTQYRNISDSEGVVYSIEELTEEVESYIENYKTPLEISDIFVFSDSQYYFSIIEEETQRGAMELLVNPYTKEIYPEYGPNMMWNLKYGMHGGIGRRGMMGRGYYDNDLAIDNDNISIDNDLTYEQAMNEANDYLIKTGEALEVGEEYHEFYGYYTFHVVKDDNPYGMLSVNGYTGEVWYHNWHGELIEIIEMH